MIYASVHPINTPHTQSVFRFISSQPAARKEGSERTEEKEREIEKGRKVLPVVSLLPPPRGRGEQAEGDAAAVAFGVLAGGEIGGELVNSRGLHPGLSVLGLGVVVGRG